jgi:hypothetical protein
MAIENEARVGNACREYALPASDERTLGRKSFATSYRGILPFSFLSGNHYSSSSRG